jgi:MFS family permease
MSGYAGGNLAGYLLAGSLPRPNGKVTTIFLLALLTAFGVVLGLFSIIRLTWVDFGLNLILGMGNGYIAILMFTWMQTRTPKEMLGRMMSMIMLSSTGLVPLSQAISGAVSKWSLSALFLSAGILVLLVVLWAAFQPGLKSFSESLMAPQSAD